MTNTPMLRRDSSHGVVGGVCAGLARTWQVDPLLVRAGFLVAVVISWGLGLVLYGVLWAALPADASRRTPTRNLSPTHVIAIIALLVFAIFVALPEGRDAAVGLSILALLAAGWYLTRHRRRPASTTRPAEQVSQWKQPPGSPQVGLAQNPLLAVTRRAPLGGWVPIVSAVGASWLALAIVSVAAGSVRPVAYPSIALAIMAIALLASARPRGVARPRPRGLVLAGLATSLVTLSLILPSATPASQAVTQGPISASEEVIELGIGRNTVDLSQRTLTSDHQVTITGDAGSLTLLLPTDVNVEMTYQVDAGRVRTPQQSDAQGMDLQLSESYASDPAKPTLRVLVALGMGTVEVRR